MDVKDAIQIMLSFSMLLIALLSIVVTIIVAVTKKVATPGFAANGWSTCR